MRYQVILKTGVNRSMKEQLTTTDKIKQTLGIQDYCPTTNEPKNVLYGWNDEKSHCQECELMGDRCYKHTLHRPVQLYEEEK